MFPQRLSETDLAVGWLRQFRPADQATATALIDAMTVVSHREFFERLRACVLHRSKGAEGLVGLFAEREVRKHRGVPNRLFTERRSRPRRAFGSGPSPVKPTRTLDPEVGSEGLISWLITELCRAHPRTFRSHPGPDQIRRERIRRLILVTDFIGTGSQALSYLEAVWRVASVKSWASLKLLRFEVVAYSATAAGKAAVEAHRSRPVVSIVTPCPTIADSFSGSAAAAVRSLCIEHDPVNQSPRDSLGFGGFGALIAFEHGCPNNVPRLLYKTDRRKRWKPLFPARVTTRAATVFGDKKDVRTLSDRLERLGERRLARGALLRRIHPTGRAVLMVLAALRRGPRREDVVASRTGLTIPEVRVILSKISAWRWISPDLRLTDLGHEQLAYARAMREPERTLPPEPVEPYYPSSLRAPTCV